MIETGEELAYLGIKFKFNSAFDGRIKKGEGILFKSRDGVWYVLNRGGWAVRDYATGEIAASSDGDFTDFDFAGYEVLNNAL